MNAMRKKIRTAEKEVNKTRNHGDEKKLTQKAFAK